MPASSVSMIIDTAPTAGLGHLARCRSIAIELRARGVGVRAVVDEPLPPAVQAWATAFDTVVSGLPDRDLATSDLLLLDSYVRSPAELPGGPRRMVLDDGPGRAVDAEVVVNPNLGATDEGYATRAGGWVLAGASYALLSPEARHTRAEAPPASDGTRRVLVTCGAGDPTGMTERYLDGLVGLDTDVRVVIGPFNERREAIARRADQQGWTAITDELDLTRHEAWADLALTTLGTTATELAFLGVPNLATAIDRRQLPHLHDYEELGVVVSLGWHEDLVPERIADRVASLLGDPGELRARRRASTARVDGRGAGRVADSVVRLMGLPT